MSEITAKSKKELCNEYKISYRTLKIWTEKVKGLGQYIGGKYTPLQVRKIYEHVGAPE